LRLKAAGEREADGLGYYDVLESVLNATGIKKVLRSRSGARSHARERLYVIEGQTGDLVVLPTPYAYDAYPNEWVATLKKMKALGATALVPGHGPVQHDRTYLDALVAMIEAVREQVSEAVKQGLSLEETRKRVDVAHEGVSKLSGGVAGFLGADRGVKIVLHPRACEKASVRSAHSSWARRTIRGPRRVSPQRARAVRLGFARRANGTAFADRRAPALEAHVRSLVRRVPGRMHEDAALSRGR
jgi:hypothetical protein